MLVIVVGVLLLLGERFSRFDFPGMNQTGQASYPVGTDEESMLSGQGQSQQQLSLMQSESFVVRSGSRLSYDDALALYQGNVLQFNEACELASRGRSFNMSNEIMIDNRSSKPNTFTVGSASVVVGPYDFGFLILREKGTAISVDCGIRKNVAELVVQ